MRLYLLSLFLLFFTASLVKAQNLSYNDLPVGANEVPRITSKDALIEVIGNKDYPLTFDSNMETPEVTSVKEGNGLLTYSIMFHPEPGANIWTVYIKAEGHPTLKIPNVKLKGKELKRYRVKTDLVVENAYLLDGERYFNDGDFQMAKAYFQQALNDPKVKTIAQVWIERCENAASAPAPTPAVQTTTASATPEPTPSQENFFDKGLSAYTNEMYPQAFEYFTKAHHQGNINGSFYLGMMLEYGISVAKNVPEAFQLYTKAAEAGNAKAQANLAFFYFKGIVVEKDVVKAEELYRKAAEKNVASAQFVMGFLYSKGIVVEKNETTGVQWYEKAAKQSYMMAQYNLAIMKQDGRGGPKDLNAAKQWYTKAAEMGHPKAKERLKLVNEQLGGL